MKGAALGPLLYPDPLLRPMLDLDFMVLPHHIEDARAMLYDLGYCHGVWHPDTNRVTEVDYGYTSEEEHHEIPALIRVASAASPIKAALAPRSWRWRHIKCHFDTERVSFPVFVDIHFNLSVGFSLDDVWRGARSAIMFDRPVRVQSVTSMLWFIAARLYNEAFQFNTLKMLMFGDAHTILERSSADVDWDELLDVADRYSMQAALYYVLSQLRNIAGSNVPERVISELRPPSTGLPLPNDWGDVMPKLFSRAIIHDVALA
jgi:hypothetical protein